MNDYSHLKKALHSINDEAEKALSERQTNRVAIKEAMKEFPFDYISVFKLFIDYGPYIYKSFIINEIGRDDSYQELISPVALSRFFRILVISYQIGVLNGEIELSQMQIKKLNDFVEIIDLLMQRANARNKTMIDAIKDNNLYFIKDADYLMLAAKLRTNLNEIAEYEFLGEQNWSHQGYRPITKGKFLLLANSYIDWNPLMQEESFPDIRIVDIYPNDVGFEYSELRDKLIRPPPISMSNGVHIEIENKIPSADDIKNYIRLVENRFRNAECFFRSINRNELEYYYINRHLTPLYIVQSKYRSRSWKPPREIIKSICSERYSGTIDTTELYVIRYYELLIQGASNLLKQVDLYE